MFCFFCINYPCYFLNICPLLSYHILTSGNFDWVVSFLPSTGLDDFCTLKKIVGFSGQKEGTVNFVMLYIQNVNQPWVFFYIYLSSLRFAHPFLTQTLTRWIKMWKALISLPLHRFLEQGTLELKVVDQFPQWLHFFKVLDALFWELVASPCGLDVLHEGLRINKITFFLFQDNINVEEMFRSITELVLRSKKGGQPRPLKPKMGLPRRK
jgi:hypothetical protein